MREVIVDTKMPGIQKPEAGSESANQPPIGAEPNKAEPKSTPQNGDSEPKSDPIAALAQELGWKPDFNGDGAVDARTFILRSREINDGLSKKVRNLTRQLSAVQEGIDTIRHSTEQASKQEIGKLKAEISDLKAQRKVAITEGRAEDVDVLDGHIEARQDQIRGSEVKPQAKKQANQPSPEYEDWVETNTWYLDQPDLQRYADTLAQTERFKALAAANLTTMFDRLTEEVKKEFPDRFGAKKNTASQANVGVDDQDAEQDSTPSSAVASAKSHPAVSPSRRRAQANKTKATAEDLNFDQRRIGRDCVARGIYKNLDEYAQALADMMAGQEAK